MRKEILVLDTDMDTDCDDAGALAVLHALVDRGQVEIAGVICDVGNAWAAACVKAINRSCGRPEIPVAINRRPYEENPKYRDHYLRTSANRAIYNETVARGGGVSPDDDAVRSLDGVALYRKILAEAEDCSITVCAIGLLTVLADLLESGPCGYSPLSGRELVTRKVKRLVTMAKAAFPEGRDGFNWEMDRSSSASVLNHWPLRLTINAVGDDVLTGRRLMAQLPATNPVVTAYRIFGGGDPQFLRPSWDQVTVLAAANDCPELLGLAHGGTLRYDAATGRHCWSNGGNGDYVIPLVPAASLATYVESLMCAPFLSGRSAPPFPLE